MKRQPMWWMAALVAGALSACTDPAPTVGSVAGKITAATDGASLAEAAVTFDSGGYAASTGADGTYQVGDVQAGTYTVSFAKDGYVTRERSNVVVAAGGTLNLDVTLAAATGTAQLTVRDGCADAPLQGATVTRAGAAAVTTDASGEVSLADLPPGSYAFDVTASGFLPARVDVTVAAGVAAEKEAVLLCQTQAAGDVARAFLGTNPAPAVVTSAASLHDRLYDSLDTNDPLVVSVRAAADYAKGHVPGAINIPWTTIANDESLAKLGDPASRTAGVVNYCYTGHTGAIATAVTGMLGYTSANMKFGIVSWTRDAAARGTVAVEPDMSKNFPTETTPHTATATFEVPRLAFDEAVTPRDVVKLAARAYLSKPQLQPTIAAQALFDNLNDGNTANDPFIISARKPEDYAKGHIPGAINIPWSEIAREENLRKIPTDRDVVIYCYTGHTAGVAAGVLGTLGYHRVKNLKYGMAGWTQDATVRAIAVFNAATDAHDYPVTTGTSP